MSYSYTLSSPIDVFLNGSNASMRLFNGSTFSTNIQTTAMSTTEPFILPASLGTNGQALQYNSAESQWGTLPFSTIINTPSGTSTVSNYNTNNIPISVHMTGPTILSPSATASSSFVRVGIFRFRGTSIDGSPSSMYAVIGGIVTTGDVSVRIFNSTNSVIIGTSTGVATTTIPQIVNIPITNLFPSGAAMMEIQLAVVGGGTARLWHTHILY